MRLAWRTRISCVLLSRKCGLKAIIIDTLITIGCLCGWFAIGASESTVAAQRLERPQELRLPGSDVTLRVDWQLLFHEECHFAVPKSWLPTVDHSLTRSRDGALTLVVARVPFETWSGHKAQILATLPSAVVEENTDSRFRLHVEDGQRLLGYVAVHDGAAACTGEIEVNKASAAKFSETMNRILESVGPSANLWRALSK